MANTNRNGQRWELNPDCQIRILYHRQLHHRLKRHLDALSTLPYHEIWINWLTTASKTLKCIFVDSSDRILNKASYTSCRNWKIKKMYWSIKEWFYLVACGLWEWEDEMEYIFITDLHIIQNLFHNMYFIQKSGWSRALNESAN